ncbi:MAG TPA: FAD-dependent oxidoreductase [Solirubrobacteraceae bacterium]|nr:FAD-dependent oxidoreductase [Solirubrobacteraceae bacterium]
MPDADNPAKLHRQSPATDMSGAAQAQKSIAIVGGGIAGLFCALKLSEESRTGDSSVMVTVFEAAPRFGGRIETVEMSPFHAEFGPMRFELETQPFLKQLVGKFGLDKKPFTSTRSDDTAARSAYDRYTLRSDEMIHYADTSGRSSATEPLDLLRLAILRLFREPLFEYLRAEGHLDSWGWTRAQQKDSILLDLCLDTTLRIQDGGGAPGDTESPQDEADGENASSLPHVAACSTGDGSSVSLAQGKPRHGNPAGEPPADWELKDQPELLKRRRAIQEWVDHLCPGVAGSCPREWRESEKYDELRRHAKHRGYFLRDEGFWNAVAEELSPAAIRYMQEDGTFYHLLPENPNAVEWGIFWLRLFHRSGSDLTTLAQGSHALVQCLVDELVGRPNVFLRPAQEILAVEPGPDDSVLLTVRDRRNDRDYRVDADHCVLALPLEPLRRLSDHFPEPIYEDLHRMFGFPLLKCIIQVGSPWWRTDIPAQTGVAGIPARELHFDREGNEGLAILYTDQPAGRFWSPFVELPVHDKAEVGSRDSSLKRALAQQILLQARRQAHIDLTHLLLDWIAADPPNPAGIEPPVLEPHVGVWEDHVARFVTTVDTWAAENRELISTWCKGVGLETGRAPVGIRELEQVFDVLRNPGHPKVVPLLDDLRPQVWGTLVNSAFDAPLCPECFCGGRECSLGRTMTTICVSVVHPDQEATSVVHEAGFIQGKELSHDSQIDAAAKTIRTWGIRDWARPPVSAGCHAWSVGAQSYNVIPRLQAFGLMGRATRSTQNMHICGEAVSEYTGFIEGALRSADGVVENIRGQLNRDNWSLW